MEFVKHNKALNRSSSFCNPPKKVKEKPVLPAESSPKLPSQLQGKHYDSSWQICKDLDVQLDINLTKIMFIC